MKGAQPPTPECLCSGSNLHLKLYSNTSVQKGRGIVMPVCLSTQKAKYNYNVHSYIEYTVTIYYHRQE